MAHRVYGLPLRELVELSDTAEQCSPLIPGSQSLEASAEGSLQEVVIAAPAGTIERRYVLAMALKALAVGGRLTALAPKDKGGSRITAELESFGCAVGETSKKHHRICSALRPKALQGLEEAIAQGGLHFRDALGLWTQAGVFSWDRVDAGTSLLLQHLPVLKGRGADFGCGLGVLARAVLASQVVESLTLVDIDRRAIAAAKKNIADRRVDFCWADIRTASLPSALDFVVMNPPFHAGSVEDKALGQLFIERAAASLKKGGQCWLVANRHLPYELVLENSFTHVRRLAEADGFKIYAAEK